MKKRIASLFLVMVMIFTMVPTTLAATPAPMSYDFPEPVEVPMPDLTGTGLPEPAELPVPRADGFLAEGYEPLTPQADGLLREPERPMPTWEHLGLPQPVADHAPDAVAIGSVEELQTLRTGGSYYLTQDLAISGSWTLLDLSGDVVLDGQGHTISVQNVPDWDGLAEGRQVMLHNLIFRLEVQSGTAGLFRAVTACTLRNCRVDCVSTAAKAAAPGGFGVLFGSQTVDRGSLTLDHCVVTGDFSGAAAGAYGTIAGLTAGECRDTVELLDCAIHLTVAEGAAEAVYGLTPSLLCEEAEKVFRMENSRVGLDVAGAAPQAQCLFRTATVPGIFRLSDCIFALENTARSPLADALTVSDAVFDNLVVSGRVQASDPGSRSKNASCGMVGSLQVPYGYWDNSIACFYRCRNLADYTVTADPADLYCSAGGLAGFLSSGRILVESCLNEGSFRVPEGGKISCAGGLFGLISVNSFRNTEFKNCSNEAPVTAGTAGGLVGSITEPSFHDDGNETYSSTFTNCRNTADISAYGAAGGLAGDLPVEMTNCLNTGKIHLVDRSGGSAGGLVGAGGPYSNSSSNAVGCHVYLTNCRSTGNLVYHTSADNPESPGFGGLAGSSNLTRMTGCAYTGQLILAPGETLSPESVPSVGGLICGSNEFYADRCTTQLQAEGFPMNLGGLAAGCDNGRIASCLVKVTAHATCSRNMSGGVASVGWGYYGSGSLSFENCAVDAVLHTAEMPGSNGFSPAVGGLVGKSLISLSFSKCRVSGSIKNDSPASGYAGGLAGCVDLDSARSSTLLIGQCLSTMDVGAGNYVGGLVGSTEMITNQVFSSAAMGVTLTSAGKTKCLGGLMGYAPRLLIRDSCFTGNTVTPDATFTGGIVGHMPSQSRNAPIGVPRVYNCYAKTDLVSSRDGEWTAVGGGIGGIVGTMDLGTIERCSYEGNISRHSDGKTYNIYQDDGGYPNQFSGGIVGLCKNGSVTCCQATGVIGGAVAGGIAGKCPLVQNCRADVNLEVCPGCNMYHYHYEAGPKGGHQIGGIVGCGRIVTDCQVLSPISIDFTNSSGTGTTLYNSLYAGGAVGYVMESAEDQYALVQRVTTKGISVTERDCKTTQVGGLVGSADYNSKLIVDSCSMEGDVSLYATGDKTNWDLYGSLYVGGLVGNDNQRGASAFSHCSVKGRINAFGSDFRTPFGPRHIKNPQICVGALAGSADAVIDDGSTVDVEIAHTSADHCFLYANHLMVGSGDFRSSAVVVPDLPPKPTTQFSIHVMSYDPQQVQYADLGGVEVRINGVQAGSTDAQGRLDLKNQDLTLRPAIIAAKKSGYFDSEQTTMIAEGGKITMVLKKRIPGEIYFLRAELLGERPNDVLSPYNKTLIPQTQEEPQPFRVKVDWNMECNEIQPDTQELHLVNGDGSMKIGLENEITKLLNFSDSVLFKPGETLYLEARAKLTDGREIYKKQQLSMEVVPVQFSLPTEMLQMPLGSAGPKDNAGLYFLSQMNVGVGFGDLKGYAADISYKNGVLTVNFGKSWGEDQTMPAFKKGSATLRTEVRLNGSLSIPLLPDCEEGWNGTVTFGINDDLDVDTDTTLSFKMDTASRQKEMFSVEYPFDVVIPPPVPMVVPCFLETGLGFGGRGEVSFSGPLEKPDCAFTLRSLLYGSVYAGIGRTISPDVELKIGAKGELLGDLSTSFQPKQPIDGALKGAISGQAVVKAYEIDLEASLTLGAFDWQFGQPVKWSLLGQEPQAAGLLSAEGQWKPISADYLTRGGGFMPGSPTLLAQDPQAADHVLYGNIGSFSDCAMGVVNGSPVVYYTANNGSGDPVSKNTVLYATTKTDSGWSAPVAISTPGAFPAAPHASGSAVTWVESTDDTDLKAMLQSSTLKVRVGETTYTLPTTGYVYSPHVFVNSDGTYAAVTWRGEDQTAWSCVMTNGVWADKASPRGDSVPAAAGAIRQVLPGTLYSGFSDYFLTEDGTVWRTSGRNGTEMAAREVAAMGLSGEYHAYLSDAGELTIMGRSAEPGNTDGYVLLHNQQVRTDSTRPPLVLTERTRSSSYIAVLWTDQRGVYCTWTQDGGLTWSRPTCLFVADGAPEGLQGTLHDGKILLSYYERQGENRNLCIRQMGFGDPDLLLTSASFDAEASMESGVPYLKGEIFNNSSNRIGGSSIRVLGCSSNPENPEKTDDVLICTVQGPTLLDPGQKVPFSVPIWNPDVTETYERYRLEVIPMRLQTALVDRDPLDNGRTVTVPCNQAEILDAKFLPDYAAGADKAQMEVLVRNTGVNPLQSLSIQVSAPGQPDAAVQTWQDVPMGSTRQLLMSGVQPGLLYQVAIKDGAGTVLDTTMLYYDDPTALKLSVSELSVTGTDAALKLICKNGPDLPVRPALAFYEADSDRLVSMALADQTLMLDGTNALSLALSQPLGTGQYRYRLFFLSGGNPLAPVLPARSGTYTP